MAAKSPKFEIITKVSVTSFLFIWIGPYLYYGSTVIINICSLGAGIDFRHQNLTSIDVRFWCLKWILALKGSIYTVLMSLDTGQAAGQPRVRGMSTRRPLERSSLPDNMWPSNQETLTRRDLVLVNRLRRWPNFQPPLGQSVIVWLWIFNLQQCELLPLAPLSAHS